MAHDPEEILNNAVRRAVEFRGRMAIRLMERLALPVGSERMGSNALNGMIQLANEGDEGAMQSIRRLGEVNGHDEAEDEACPLCEQIDEVLQQ